MTGRSVGAFLCALALTVPVLAQGKPPAKDEPAAPAAPPADPKLEEAKRLFLRGKVFFDEGDFVRALEFFQASRETFQSVPNTLNAAVCLEKLGRLDEALELYEILLTEYRDDLSPENRANLGPVMAGLRAKVGSLEVNANVEGAVVVDGKTRGHLPLRGPIRVLPGKRTVRIVKTGYETFERQVTIRATESTPVTATLTPLAQSGVLRVEGEELKGAEVYVDGALVGTLPWEGSLKPGAHLYWVRLGDRGSAPVQVTVVERQTALSKPEVRDLGPDISVTVDPPSAELRLGGVLVGKGRWRGRLPLGTIEIEAREDGYRAGKRTQPISATSRDVKLTLTRDPDHPRWARASSGALYLDVTAGGTFGSGFGSGAESACTGASCASNGSVLGGLGLVRGGYELPVKLGVELALGYLYARTEVQRGASQPFNGGGQLASYAMTDHLTLSGPLASVGLSYRIAVSKFFSITTRAHIGALLGFASDQLDGTATDGTSSAPVDVSGSGTTKRGVNLFVAPGVDGRFRLGSWWLGAGLSVPVFFLDGPANDHGEAVIRGDTSACSTSPGQLVCAPNAGFTRAEQAFGAFVLWVPQLVVSTRL